MWEKRKKGWRITCDVGEATSQLFLQSFRRFTYVTAHSPTPPSLHLLHSSFSNPSIALPTSHLILQPFRCFTYVTAHSPTLLPLLLLHWIFTYVTWRSAHALFRLSPTNLYGSLTHHPAFVISRQSLFFVSHIFFSRVNAHMTSPFPYALGENACSQECLLTPSLEAIVTFLSKGCTKGNAITTVHSFLQKQTFYTYIIFHIIL